MWDGVDIIYQAVLADDTWSGRADFLRKVDCSKDLHKRSLSFVSLPFVRSIALGLCFLSDQRQRYESAERYDEECSHFSPAPLLTISSAIKARSAQRAVAKTYTLLRRDGTGVAFLAFSAPTLGFGVTLLGVASACEDPSNNQLCPSYSISIGGGR